MMTAGLGLHSWSVEQTLGTVGVRLYDDAFQAMSYLRAAQNDLLVAAALPPPDADTRLADALANIAVAEQRALSPAGHDASAGLQARLTLLRGLRGADRLAGFAAAADAFDTAVEIYAGDGYHLRRIVGDVMAQTMRNTLAIIAASLLVALAIVAGLTRSILPQLRAAVGIAQSIAAGRLDNAITARGRSETALLLRALATMQSAIAVSLAENRLLLEQQAAAHADLALHQSAVDGVVQRFGSSMGGVFHTVADASVGMAGTAAGLLGDATALLADERAVQDRIEQVLTRIDNASQSSHALNEAIFAIREETAQTEQRARSTQEQTKAANVRMQSLGHAAAEITSVVGMITGLAAQTKLLALNASIEAARAGPAGAGFAVVASEVKRLADGSAQAAQTVGRRIASILEAAEATRASIAVIDVSTQDVHRLSASIAQAVAFQNTASAAMRHEVSEIQANVTNVKQSLDAIGARTRAGAGNLRGIAEETTTLSSNAADLSREVSAFLEFVRSIKPGELAWSAPLAVPARLYVGGAEITGRAVFTSALALQFEPAVPGGIGAPGVLSLPELDHTMTVRIAETGANATHLLPPLTDAERTRLRAAFDRKGTHT